MDANEEAPAVIQVPKSISQEVGAAGLRIMGSGIVHNSTSPVGALQAFNKKTLQVKRKTRRESILRKLTHSCYVLMHAASRGSSQKGLTGSLLLQTMSLWRWMALSLDANARL